MLTIDDSDLLTVKKIQGKWYKKHGDAFTDRGEAKKEAQRVLMHPGRHCITLKVPTKTGEVVEKEYYKMYWHRVRIEVYSDGLQIKWQLYVK